MELVLVVVIVLIGALTRTVFGFGEALVTMPLLALISFDLKTSIALIGALGLLVALPAAIHYRQKIDYGIVLRLIIGSILGVPTGLYLINHVKTNWILRGLAIFLMVYGAYSLGKIFFLHQSRAHLRANFWDFVAGFVSGTFGSAYNSHGVPVVIYGTLKKWPIDQLRGILQAHFVVTGSFVVIGQAVSGFWNLDVLKILLICIPLLFIVIPFGNWLNDHIDAAHMVKYIYGALIIFGLLLLIRT